MTVLLFSPVMPLSFKVVGKILCPVVFGSLEYPIIVKMEKGSVHKVEQFRRKPKTYCLRRFISFNYLISVLCNKKVHELTHNPLYVTDEKVLLRHRDLYVLLV